MYERLRKEQALKTEAKKKENKEAFLADHAGGDAQGLMKNGI